MADLSVNLLLLRTLRSPRAGYRFYFATMSCERGIEAFSLFGLIRFQMPN